MAPSSRLLQALFGIPRLRRAAPKSAFCPTIVTLHQLRHRATPWQLLLRGFSAERGGRDGDDREPFDSSGKAPLTGGVNSGESETQSTGGGGYDDDGGARVPPPTARNVEGESEEPRLFGEGGLFGSRRRSSDESEEEQEEIAEAPTWSAFGTEARDGEKAEDSREGAYTHPEHAGYVPGEPISGEQGWDESSQEGYQYFEPEVQRVGGEDQQTWLRQEDTRQRAAAYAGVWERDGRFRKALPEPLDEDGGARYPPTSEDPAFGELIKRSGFTDDDIANLMAGFYEPVGLPHLDDYKFVDMEAERKKKRRELELAKMAEMAKRWVRKVDDQGFSHGVGRRKRSRARVWIREGEGKIIINRMHHDMYFTFIHSRVEYLEPFVITDTLGMFDTFVLVKGGGVSGQASAIRHGLSRALMWYEPSLRAPLKRAGMLRRDDREVERKKPGKAKARKSYQWVKR